MKEIHATFYIIVKRKQTICKCQNSKAEQKKNVPQKTKATWKIGKTFFEGVFILFGTGFYICFNFYVVKLQIFWERDKNFWKNLPLTFFCGIFFQILWPCHNIWTMYLDKNIPSYILDMNRLPLPGRLQGTSGWWKEMRWP